MPAAVTTNSLAPDSSLTNEAASLDTSFSSRQSLNNLADLRDQAESRFGGQLSTQAVARLCANLDRVIERATDFIASPANGTNPLSDSILSLRFVTSELNKQFPEAQRGLSKFRDDFLNAVGEKIKGLTTPEDVCIKLGFPANLLGKLLPDRAMPFIFKMTENAQRFLEALQTIVEESQTMNDLSDLFTKPAVVVLSQPISKIAARIANCFRRPQAA